LVLQEKSMSKTHIDDQIYDLYDEYCHGRIDRRQFFERAGAVAVTGVAMASALMPNYADAQEILFTDERIKATWVNYSSPGGNSGVMHENRGLNPYIQDVARRAAVAGFLALAPDGLSPIGGYPGNDDDGRAMQRSLNHAKLQQDMVNSARYLRTHELSNGKLGATGFCWGGGTTNFLATEMGDELAAGAPFYGAAADTDKVSQIKAALLVHYAEDDPRVNAMREDFEAALQAHGVRYQMHTYPETRHGFHNYSTPRFNPESASLAWERTVAFFHEHLD
jgi:carboxymethylenebutenolidase